MPYEIQKQFHFSASHVLEGLADGHPCGRLHGHNYEVTCAISSDTLDEVGFVVDFGELAPLGKWLDRTFDHRHLNDQMLLNPTSENLARLIHAVAHDLIPLPAAAKVRIGVSETPRSWAWYQ